MELHNGQPTYYAKNRSAWRKWLEKNAEKETSVWLILYNKNASKKSVVYEEAVEEALCFGWIDSKPNKRDHESRYLFFSRRKPKSIWSRINKQRVESLVQEGLMMPPGLRAIETAKANGSWTAIDAIENLEVPEDLLKAFNKNKTAKNHFANFPASVKKGILYWVQSAKKTETRQKRIVETVSLAAKNQRANQYQPKKD